ncbi:FliA/WhiG family RNA polymerase sigma factor [Ruminococcaceae bacterium OttesenSCG-928-D13]|nr:FliA/WhiG family RNA polymerase sigma factor [Ruminococcaceae bacterium OttesenSCG-928-D13]
MAGPDDKFRLEDPAKALETYQRTGDADLRNDLLMHYSYIAKSVAVQMRGITGGYAQVEDIVNEGIITLMDCLDKYTPDKGMKFENYAYMRVRNANIDFVRKQDWVPRRVRRTAREVSEAYNALSTELMREPTNKELAAHMNVPEETIHKHLAEMNAGAVLSFEELLASAMPGAAEQATLAGAEGADTLPERDLMQTELRAQLVAAIDSLTEKERLVVSLYYYERLKLHEIATIMGVSESRISQTHSKAILKMKQRLTAYVNM